MKAIHLLVLSTVLFVPLLATAQIYQAENGLSTTGSGTSLAVKLGGTLNDALTEIDFGNGNGNSSVLFKKGSASYLYMANGGNVGIGTANPAANLHVIGTAMFENSAHNTPLIVAARNGDNLFEIRANKSSVNPSYNLFIGKNAGASINMSFPYTSANIGIGSFVLEALNYGVSNIAIGENVLKTLTIGSSNIAFGSTTLQKLEQGNGNIAIGQSAFFNKTAGNENIGLGLLAGMHNITGSRNTFIGAFSGNNNNGSGNTFLGWYSGLDLVIGNNNTILGNNTGNSINGLNNHILLADGQGNVRLKVNNSGAYFIGGSYGTPGQVLVSSGSGAPPIWQPYYGGGGGGSILWAVTPDGNGYNTAVINNIGIGTATPKARLHVNGELRCETSASNEPIITSYKNELNVLEIRASTDFDDSYFNLFIGKESGRSVNLSSGKEQANTGVGNFSLRNLTTGEHNTAIGESALMSLTTGNANLALGNFAFANLISGGGNTAVGRSVFSANTSGSENVGLGIFAGLGNITGSRNTIMGAWSGFNSTGSSNIFLGYHAGRNLITGNYNIVVGSNDGASIDGLNNHILLADGEGNERLKINNNGAYAVGGDYGITGMVLTSNGDGAAPSWQKVECCSGGGELGDSHAVLLKRIDELAAYIIKVNAKLEKLQTENERLKKQPGKQ